MPLARLCQPDGLPTAETGKFWQWTLLVGDKRDDPRAIQGWLGHRSITSTAVYTALAPNRFKDFWRD
jgi:hypothetical protein